MNENNFSLFSALLVHFSSVKLISPHSDAFISFSKVKIANLADQIKDPSETNIPKQKYKRYNPRPNTEKFQKKEKFSVILYF